MYDGRPPHAGRLQHPPRKLSLNGSCCHVPHHRGDFATGRRRTRVIVRCGRRQVGAYAECTRASIRTFCVHDRIVLTVKLSNYTYIHPAHATTFQFSLIELHCGPNTLDAQMQDSTSCAGVPCHGLCALCSVQLGQGCDVSPNRRGLSQDRPLQLQTSIWSRRAYEHSTHCAALHCSTAQHSWHIHSLAFLHKLSDYLKFRFGGLFFSRACAAQLQSGFPTQALLPSLAETHNEDHCFGAHWCSGRVGRGTPPHH